VRDCVLAGACCLSGPPDKAGLIDSPALCTLNHTRRLPHSVQMSLSLVTPPSTSEGTNYQNKKGIIAIYYEIKFFICI